MFYLVPFGKWAKTIKASLTSFSSFHATYRLQYLKKYQKIRDFLLFSRGIERAKWFGMGYTGCVANAISRTISLKLNWIRTVSFFKWEPKILCDYLFQWCIQKAFEDGIPVWVLKVSAPLKIFRLFTSIFLYSQVWNKGGVNKQGQVCVCVCVLVKKAGRMG